RRRLSGGTQALWRLFRRDGPAGRRASMLQRDVCRMSSGVQESPAGRRRAVRRRPPVPRADVVQLTFTGTWPQFPAKPRTTCQCAGTKPKAVGSAMVQREDAMAGILGRADNDVKPPLG